MALIHDTIATQEEHARISSVAHLLPILTPIVVLAVALIGYVAFLRPQLLELRSLRLRSALVSDVGALQQRLAQLEHVHEVFTTDLKDVQARIDAALPDQVDVPHIVSTLDAAAQRSGVVVASMELNREAPPADLDRILGKNEVLLIGLTVRNVTYAKLKVLLSVLGRSERLIDTLSVQYTPNRQSAVLRLRMYTMQ